jgi:hypothetical protein
MKYSIAVLSYSEILTKFNSGFNYDLISPMNQKKKKKKKKKKKLKMRNVQIFFICAEFDATNKLMNIYLTVDERILSLFMIFKSKPNQT